MKKMIFVVFGLLFSTGILTAQNITIGTASIAKATRPCVVANYNMPSDIIRTALADKLKKAGIKISKGSKVKGGFRVYKGVSIPEISNDRIDVYTKISGKKDNSVMNFAVSKGYDNFVSPDTDSEMVAKMKTYVKSMVANVDIANIKAKIAEQAKVVNKAEKAQKSKEKTGSSLASDKKSLEEKLEKNKKDIAANRKDQEEAVNNVKKEAKVLADLKAKLESMLKQ